MRIIFLDGESKSGKTAAGRHIFTALQAHGYNVRLLVAGNYFRHLTLLTLREAPLAELTRDRLEQAVRTALRSKELLRPIDDLNALEQPEVEALVSTIGEFDFVQEAFTIWRRTSAQQGLDDKIEILLFDGRNVRARLQDWLAVSGATVALELLEYCRPEAAAARYLADEGNNTPTAEELAEATRVVADRRQRDRERSHAAYVDPNDPVTLVVGRHTVDEALAAAFAPGVANPPRPIRFDNSDVSREDGLCTVTELALKAVARTD